MYISIHSLYSILCWNTLAPITASSLFVYDATSLAHLFLGSSSHSSLQDLSSSIRSDGERRCTAIFRSLQRCSIGFKSGLWLGHSRTFTELSCSHSFVILAVCLGSLSCWKMNLHPSLRSRALWSRFSSRMSLYIAAFIFPSILTSLPVPAAEKHPHSMMLPRPCSTVGMVLARWWVVPGFLQTWRSIIQSWLVECCRDGCSSGRFSSLHRHAGALSEWPSGFWSPPWWRSFSPDRSVWPGFL